MYEVKIFKTIVTIGFTLTLHMNCIPAVFAFEPLFLAVGDDQCFLHRILIDYHLRHLKKVIKL